MNDSEPAIINKTSKPEELEDLPSYDAWTPPEPIKKPFLCRIGFHTHNTKNKIVNYDEALIDIAYCYCLKCDKLTSMFMRFNGSHRWLWYDQETVNNRKEQIFLTHEVGKAIREAGKEIGEVIGQLLK